MTIAQRILCAHGLGVLTSLMAVLARPHVADQPLGLRLLVAVALVMLSGIGLRALIGPLADPSGDSSGPNRPGGTGLGHP